MQVLSQRDEKNENHKDVRVRAGRTADCRGFSLLEMMIVCAIFLIVGGITTMALIPAWQQTRITNAYNTTLMVVRRAHDEAVAERRVFVVSFNNSAVPNTVTVTQNNTAGPVLVSAVLPPEVAFTTVSGIPTSNSSPPTTPDSFGTGGYPVDLDVSVTPGVTTIFFYPDGTAQDNVGNVSNGVVYVARPGDLYSSRAITVWGATGRVRGWRLFLTGTQNYWRQL
jgi:prepilin-type N-terminal cleavage/methylation domain-containing protein